MPLRTSRRRAERSRRPASRERNHNPAAQSAAFDLHKKQMDKEISGAGLEQYFGKSVAGIPVTRDGLYGSLN